MKKDEKIALEKKKLTSKDLSLGQLHTLGKSIAERIMKLYPNSYDTKLKTLPKYCAVSELIQVKKDTRFIRPGKGNEQKKLF